MQLESMYFLFIITTLTSLGMFIYDNVSGSVCFFVASLIYVFNILYLKHNRK